MAAAAAGILLAAACNDQSPGAERAAGAHGAGPGPVAGVVAQHNTVPRAGGVEPGIHPSVVYGALHNPDAGSAAAAATGRQLFVQYNCSGCHGGRAGGGMGPSLRDKYWIYGNSDAQLYSTIIEGRSAGMPAWGAKIPRSQIWELITYIRTLGTPQEPDPPPAPANPPAGPTVGPGTGQKGTGASAG